MGENTDKADLIAKTAIVIPAYNESARIRPVIETLLDRGYLVVVVDDGSSDDTYDVLLGSGAIALQHSVNLGQGAALATALRYLERRPGVEFVVTFDADGQHHPDDIPKAVKALSDSDAEVLLGSRFLGETDNMPTSRLLLLKAATLFTRLTTGLKVTDTHNGFRVIRANQLPRFRLRHNRMAHASEVHDIVKRHNIPYIEFPNRIRYTDETLEKGQRLSGAFAILSDLAFGRLYR